MGMHVDHGRLLSLSSNGLTPKVRVCATLFANYRAIYFKRHSEASAFPQLWSPLALNLGWQSSANQPASDAWSSRKRILPAQASKAREIAAKHVVD
jgi:hypothetical protein